MSDQDAKTGEPSDLQGEFGTTATAVVETEAPAQKPSVFARILRFNDPDGQLDDEVTEALKKGDFRRVQELTDAILEQDPDNVDARIDKAHAFAIEGNLKESMRLNLEALELEPENTTALNNLGCDYADMGKHEEALEMYMKAHELDPADTLILSNIVYTLQDLNRPEETVKYTEMLKNFGIDVAAMTAGHVAGDLIADAITGEPETEVAEALVGAALDMGDGPLI